MLKTFRYTRSHTKENSVIILLCKNSIYFSINSIQNLRLCNHKMLKMMKIITKLWNFEDFFLQDLRKFISINVFKMAGFDWRTALKQFNNNVIRVTYNVNIIRETLQHYTFTTTNKLRISARNPEKILQYTRVREEGGGGRILQGSGKILHQDVN